MSAALEQAVRDFFSYMEIVEVSDGGREFRPNTISSCRAMDMVAIDVALTQMRKLVSCEVYTSAPRAATPEDDTRAFAEATNRRLDDARDAKRWRKGIWDGEFPINRDGQWMHVCRTTGRILNGHSAEEVIDAAIAAE